MAKKNETKTEGGVTPGSELMSPDMVAEAADIFGGAGLVTRATSESLLDALDGQIVERVCSMKEGDMMKGRFLGEGTSIAMLDPKTGEMRPVKTWRLESLKKKDMVARIIGSYQLDDEMSCCAVGDIVTVVRGPQTETRTGRRVNEWVVGRSKKPS